MDRIGKITGTATFESVTVEPSDEDSYLVHGAYMGSETSYEVPHGALYIGGLKTRLEPESTLHLEPDKDDILWVEATDDALYISESKPE